MSDWTGVGLPVDDLPTPLVGMEYKDIRQKFVEISGRYDLVNSETWEDNGADFYLNMGQRMLDRYTDSIKMYARYPFKLTTGTIIAKTPGLRSIKEVWIANVNGRAQLSPVPLDQLRKEFAKESKGKITSAKWIDVDIKNLKITITALPEKEDFEQVIDIQRIVEFYSK